MSTTIDLSNASITDGKTIYIAHADTVILQRATSDSKQGIGSLILGIILGLVKLSGIFGGIFFLM